MATEGLDIVLFWFRKEREREERGGQKGEIDQNYLWP
jgi:hypothetical protein